MGSKSGSGFFHLFEWTWKPRKKLPAAGGNASIEEIVQEKVNGDDDDTPASELHVIDVDAKSGVLSVRDSSEYSFDSSVTDEEGSRIRNPGVVARLMGLDSMPTPGISEPHSTPLHDSRVLRDKPGENKKYCASFVTLRSDVNSRKTVELRSEKMPSSPIQKFQVEALPPRSAKPISFSHHKLLSPVKNPGLISADIIKPALQNSTKGKIQSSKLSSTPSKVCDPRKVIATPQKTSRPSESPKGPVQSFALKSHGSESLGRSQNGLENSESLLGIKKTRQPGAKDKGKSVSLAIQAKLNVQRREGLSANTRNKLLLERKVVRPIDKPFHSIDQKGISGTDSSNVLRQNKQNYLASKRKLVSKPSVSNQRERKIVSRDASSGKEKVVNDLKRNSKVCYSIAKDLETSGTGKDIFTLDNRNTCQTRLIENGPYSKRSVPVDNMPVNKQRKHIRHHVVIGDQSRWMDDNVRNGTDVVSFTFKSPLSKPVCGSQPLSHEGEKLDKHNGYDSYPYAENASCSDGKSFSSLKLNVIEGDYLGFLLELKLRELASRTQSPYRKSNKGGGAAAPESDLRDSASTFDVPAIASSEKGGESLLQSCDDEVCSSNSNCSVTSAQVPCMRHKVQGINKVDCCCSIVDPREPHHQYESPLSILENSFSNESCFSSESFENTDGSRTDSSYYSSALAEDIVEVDYMNNTLSIEAEMELLDSASSCKQVIDIDLASGISRIDHTDSCLDELGYVKETLTYSEFMSDDLAPHRMDQSGEILDPLIFEMLEEKQILAACEVEEKHRRMRRKIIFDSVNECLDSKYSLYFRAGFRMWAKGVIFFGKDLAQKLYNEISGWNSMEDWMVDELVDKDMSTHLGRWIDFEAETFEAGAEIERCLFDTLVDELFADFQVKEPLEYVCFSTLL